MAAWYLIGSGERRVIAAGYALGAALMLIAAAVTLRLGVRAERRFLGAVAALLSSGT